MKQEFKRKLREFSYRSNAFSAIYHIASDLKTRRYANMPDEEYLKMMFKIKTGNVLNLDNPVGFNEKLQWLKLYNRRPEYTIMVDKVLAKELVAGILGKEYIIPTLGVWSNPDDINFEKLPNQFVLKCNHNSGGGMCICTDKTSLNIERIKRNLLKGLKSNSFLASREWPYKNVSRKVLAEEFMKDNNNKSLVDYKFYCFHGKPRFLYVGLANYHDGKKNDELTYLDLEWNPAPFYRTDHKPFPYVLERPGKFDEMLLLATKLAEGIPFVRVDLYYINGKVYFSEFTFFPGGGFNEFKPYGWEKTIGSWIDLSLVKVD